MAGLGIKKFVSGETLTADEVNGYLMDQAVCVFDTTALRDAAFGDTNEPALSEGRICYIKASNKIQYYDGSSWIDSSQFSISESSQVTAGVLALDRLVSGTANQLIVCNSSGIPTYVTLTNDATITQSGTSASLTISTNSVALGTDTTGNYVASLVAGTGISLTNNTGESATPTIAIGQDVASSANPTFAGLTADAVRIGITTAGEIDTSTGNLTLDSTGGTVTIDDILSVTGSAAVSGAASVAGLFTAASNAIVSGSTAVSGAASVAGLLTAANNLSVSGSSAVSGAASVAGLITAASGITSSSNISVTGSISVSGNVVSHAIPETTASLTNAVDGKILKVSGTSSSITLTTNGGSWTNGTQFTVINTNAGALTVAAGSGTTFLAAPLAGTNVKLRTTYSTATFICETTSASTANWYVIGDLTSA